MNTPEDFADFPAVAKAIGLPPNATPSIVAHMAEKIGACRPQAANIARLWLMHERHPDGDAVMALQTRHKLDLREDILAYGTESMDAALESHDLCCVLVDETLLVARHLRDLDNRVNELLGAGEERDRGRRVERVVVRRGDEVRS